GGTLSNGTIGLTLGQTASCTFTNDDIAPSLTLNKVVVNDNGGTATAGNFTLTASGATPLSGVGPSVTSGGSFSAGTYSLSESSLAGYTQTNLVCSGATLKHGTTALTFGQTVSCTLTNNDIAPKLTLNKVVVNDNGGTATAGNFTLTATGSGTVPLTFSGAGPTVSSPAGLDAGTYTLSESS